MRHHGVPETFWLVLKPTKHSELGDICFRCDLKQFANQVRGGLDETSIVGVFADEDGAITEAMTLLEAGKRGAHRVSNGDD